MAAASVDAEEGKTEELSFEEIRALEQEFLELTQGKVKKDLEQVRKKREEDELLGRKTAVEKTDLSDIETAFTGKKGGLPEHLANLPEDHPLRLRFEQGFRRRPDGTWFKSVLDDETQEGEAVSTKKKSALYFIVVSIILLVTVITSLKMYNKALEQKRTEILEVIKRKGFSLDDPVIRSKYQKILVTSWLPDLARLLREIERIPRNFDVFPDNPESGTYLDYIKKYKYQFNGMDAQEWYSRSIRKPNWGNTKTNK